MPITALPMLRIALVDDHLLFREGLRAVLSMQADLMIVAEASDAREAQGLARHKPDVVLLDLSLPGVDGIAVLRDLIARDAGMKVLFLSMHALPAVVSEALAAGARGYALKDQPAADVVEAIRAVARGETYLAPRIPRRLVDRADAWKGRDARPLDVLTPRERDVFRLAVAGYSNNGIAAELDIGVKTVETHRNHINRKLSVASPAELVRFAAVRGLLPDQRGDGGALA